MDSSVASCQQHLGGYEAWVDILANDVSVAVFETNWTVAVCGHWEDTAAAALF